MEKIPQSEGGIMAYSNILYVWCKCFQNFKHSSSSSGILNSPAEVHFPAEFIPKPNQTHLKKLIKTSRITRKLQAGDQGLS